MTLSATEDQFAIKGALDFATSIKHQPTNLSWIIIHEANFIDLVANTPITSLCQHLDSQQHRHIHCQTNIYDAMFVAEGKLLVSNKNMPVRLYDIKDEGQDIEWWSITDKKLNSEQYLTPIRMSKCQDTILGGGKKFVSIYDLNKNAVKARIKQMNKRFVSSLQLMDGHTFIAGQFNGELTLLDIRAQHEHHSFKPHVDLVTNIKTVPNQPNHFLSTARKDNYAYQWDIRMLHTFISFFEHALYGNQRTGCQVHQNGQMVFMGGEKGQITARSLKTGEPLWRYTDSNNDCVSSICYSDHNLLFSIGERRFPLQKDEQSKRAWIKRVSLPGS